MALIDAEVRLLVGGWTPCKVDASTVNEPWMLVLLENVDVPREIVANRIRFPKGIRTLRPRFEAVPQDAEWGIWDSEAGTWADAAAGTSETSFPTQALAQDVARLLNTVIDK